MLLLSAEGIYFSYRSSNLTTKDAFSSIKDPTSKLHTYPIEHPSFAESGLTAKRRHKSSDQEHGEKA